MHAASDQLPTWAQLRHLGAGFWLRDHDTLARTVDQLAKQQFAARRNADECALLYCALGRRSVLQVINPMRVFQRHRGLCIMPPTTTALCGWSLPGAGAVSQHAEPEAGRVFGS